ncbi:MAG: 1-deoxy-D-xylulose-5-phosphate synthase, partial [Kiritimatiellaeota bacterium]|nr:1-deoxy-D-xylulose-5-phosphate synthase [Kiritimatiellota bacterium]
NGGHLASNLGTVELTIGLLRAFDPAVDKILFDVGHQTYAYKLLTGRAERFGTLRQTDGLSGFQKPSESPYDAFGAGHAGTALSTALGMAAARDRRQGQENIVAVIGDASIANGVSLEALNHVRDATKRLIVILNDNEMSISRNVGALSRYFGRVLVSVRYNRWKQRIETFGRKRFYRRWVRRLYNGLLNLVKFLFVRNTFFETFGLRYVGPIDGHDFKLLDKALALAKNNEHPVLIHVVTVKGKGYAPAEENPGAWHGSIPFDIATGEHTAKPSAPTYTQVFGETLCQLAEQDKRIVAITAAMGSGCGLEPFAARFPERYFDVGICEAHQVTFATGLALGGLRPVVAVYSTFLQRAIDGVIHDAALQNLPVLFCLDRAGVVAGDGPTHHGVFDIPLLRPIPNLTLMQPATADELRAMMALAMTLDSPSVIRYPRGVATAEGSTGLLTCAQNTENTGQKTCATLGKAAIVADLPSDGTRPIALWALGDMVPLAHDVAQRLAENGHGVVLVNARFIKPLDIALLHEQATSGVRLFVTLENGIISGGFGSAVMEALAAAHLATPVLRFGWPDEFIPHATTNADLFTRHGLTAEAIVEHISGSCFLGMKTV